MSRIVEGPDGTRYRQVGQCHPFVAGAAWCGDFAQGDEGPFCHEHTKELPRIPHYPIPGQPPQFIAKIPASTPTRYGDRYLVLIDADGDGTKDEVWSGAESNRGNKWEGISVGRFVEMHANLLVDEVCLISRVDPEEDV